MSLILAVEPDRRQAAHLTHIVRQRVGVELLLASAAPERKMRGVLAAFRRAKPTKPATDGCDPAEFAQQISSYLESAAEVRATAQFIEPPIPVRGSATPPVASSTTQRYVPLEPGRLYRDEGVASPEVAALPP